MSILLTVIVTFFAGMDFVCNLYISLGQNRSGICQQSNSKDIEPCDGSDPGNIGSCGYGIFSVTEYFQTVTIKELHRRDKTVYY